MRTLYANDCLDVLDDGVSIPDHSVDLIYLDPPFNSKSKYNLPFKGEYGKDLRPVMAFKDTWTWSDFEQDELEKLRHADAVSRTLADIVELARRVYNERPNSNISIGAYLLNMAIRLKAMRRVLKATRSIYLHCDPTASHYLKMVMDCIYGSMRREVIWSNEDQSGFKSKANNWIRGHDVLLYYRMSQSSTFNKEFSPLDEKTIKRYDQVDELTGARYKIYDKGKETERLSYLKEDRGAAISSVWTDIPSFQKVNNTGEYLGYPTQKPESLLERIIKASSNAGDVVCDPFCGCGTGVHAAEKLNRQWIGIDISQFSTELIRNRILSNFKELSAEDIVSIGVPRTASEALQLFKSSHFEFEKWACGAVGAEGMFHRPGTKGPDGGVDGVIPFYHQREFNLKEKAEKTYAIVQVKGGKVSPDNVRGLSTVVRQTNAKCGVFICFDRYMKTVENNREKGTITDALGDFPFIQGFSVERLVTGDRPNLPVFARAA